MSEHKALSAEDLKTVKKAIKVPAKNLLSDKEREFVAQTKERLEKFGENVYLSEGQFNWLSKIASRAGDKPKAKAGKDEPAPAEDLPSYDDVAGE